MKKGKLKIRKDNEGNYHLALDLVVPPEQKNLLPTLQNAILSAMRTISDVNPHQLKNANKKETPPPKILERLRAGKPQ